MWPSGHRKDKEIPYRGEPVRKYLKRGRQFRNLRDEKREIAITIFIILTVAALIILFINTAPSSNSANTLKSSLVILAFFVFIILAVISGYKSVNKFRKGYDIDASKEESSENHDKEIE